MLRVYFLQIRFDLSDPGAERRCTTRDDHRGTQLDHERHRESRSRDEANKRRATTGTSEFHVGTDRRGVVHSVTASHAAAADITQMNALRHGHERTVFGDQAYWKEADRQRFRATGVRYV
jgi:hypothetical protein